LENIDIIIITV